MMRLPFAFLWCAWTASAAAGPAVSGFLFEPLASHPKCHAVTAVELADGSLMAAWFAGGQEGSKDQAIFCSRKVGSSGWSKPRILFDTPHVADFNPVLMNDGKLLRLFVVRAATGTDPRGSLWQLTSADEGATWSQPARVLAQEGFWSRNSPARSGARWILPVSDVQNRGARVLLSDVPGRFRISPLISAEKYLTQPAIACLGESGLVAVFRERSKIGGHVWLADSSNAGETWTAPRRLRFPNPDSGIALVALPGGKLLLVYNASDRRRTPLNTAVSADQGNTWQDGPVLESDDGEYSYPAALFARDGKVHIFYTWKRTHIRHIAAPPAWFEPKPAR